MIAQSGEFGDKVLLRWETLETMSRLAEHKNNISKGNQPHLCGHECHETDLCSFPLPRMRIVVGYGRDRQHSLPSYRSCHYMKLGFVLILLMLTPGDVQPYYDIYKPQRRRTYS